MNNQLKFLITIVIVCWQCSFVDAAWYDNAWIYRKPITVQSSEVTADLTDFPVYLDMSLLAGDNFFTEVRADGADIRITESDGVTELPYELVDINTGAETGELHFKVNGTLSSGSDTSFYIYYANGTASSYAVADTFGAQNVWTNNYEAVYHFSSDPTGTFFDSTVNDNDGSTTGSMTLADRVAGKVGNAFDLDGGDDYIIIPDHPSLDGHAQMTWQAWTNTPSESHPDGLIVKRINSGTSANYSYAIFKYTGNRLYVDLDTQNNRFSSFVFSTSVWNMTHVTFNGSLAAASRVRTYQDGTLSSTNNEASAAIPSGTAVLTLGALNVGYGNYINGLMDEVRISSAARSSSWIQTEYNMQDANVNFWNVGPFESLQSILMTVPPDNGNALAVVDNLEILFSAPPVLMNGFFTIKEADDDSLFALIDTNASSLFTTIGNNLQIMLPSPFFYNTNYYVEIDSNSIENFAGFTDNGVWNFNSGDMEYDLNFFDRLF